MAMPERLALKRLTASDLTFFESLFRSLNVGNQKSINLNADVFIESFYPNLPALVSTLGDRITVSLTILGPAGAPAYVLSRAVTKREAYKNWRLNGEFVRDPEDEPGRFNILAAGDLAIFDFTGESGPQNVSLLLIAANSPADKPIYDKLNTVVPGGRRTMIEITRDLVATAAIGAPAPHPIWTLAADPEYDAALEDAALGGSEGVEKLAAKPAKPVSAATLAAKKLAMEKNGRDGEALAWVRLNSMQESGLCSSIVWVSDSNAVSSFDFTAVFGGTKVRIDAKSTSGKFNQLFHMSKAELVAAAKDERYDLWRIYLIDEDGARLRVAEDIAKTAKAVLAGISLPKGVTVDAVSINPEILKWGDEILIERPDEDDE